MLRLAKIKMELGKAWQHLEARCVKKSPRKRRPPRHYLIEDEVVSRNELCTVANTGEILQ